MESSNFKTKEGERKMTYLNVKRFVIDKEGCEKTLYENFSEVEKVFNKKLCFRFKNCLIVLTKENALVYTK